MLEVKLGDKGGAGVDDHVRHLSSTGEDVEFGFRGAVCNLGAVCVLGVIRDPGNTIGA